MHEHGLESTEAPMRMNSGYKSLPYRSFREQDRILEVCTTVVRAWAQDQLAARCALYSLRTSVSAELSSRERA